MPWFAVTGNDVTQSVVGDNGGTLLILTEDGRLFTVNAEQTSPTQEASDVARSSLATAGLLIAISRTLARFGRERIAPGGPCRGLPSLETT